MKITPYFFNILTITLSFNCFSINFQKKDIISNRWVGESIRIAELDPGYKKQHHFNRVFSKFSSKRNIPYYKTRNKIYNIAGSFKNIDQNYIVIRDKKGRFFKINDHKNHRVLPSYIVLEKTILAAKILIGKTIWLNDVVDEKNFLTNFAKTFYPFQSVKVIDVIIFQNSDKGHPIWLKVLAESGENALVRYNLQGLKVGIKDHYFIDDPLPKEWGSEIHQEIKNRRAKIGMSSKQVRIAVGYPDEINNTSSLHGIGEQWMYKSLDKKIYFQFEYDKLVYINN
ncbi:MAG: hypothetical protein CMF94_01725 [Candidatus Marinimicrobia bacterium]|nr:hypothetical protein [Candidatus Neomarinimicrobiota bacterium]